MKEKIWKAQRGTKIIVEMKLKEHVTKWGDCGM